MREVTYLLLADGPSDEILTYVIDWTLLEAGFSGVGEFVAASQQRGVKRLGDRIARALAEAPAYDLVFVHRDGEGEGLEARLVEIERAVVASGTSATYVPIVPVRMTEAWLLADERVPREAAGNPNGTAPLDLPRLADIERLPDPKKVLLEALVVASSNKPRLRKTFDKRRARRLVAEYTEDFSPLRRLGAFRRFEEDLRNALERLP